MQRRRLGIEFEILEVPFTRIAEDSLLEEVSRHPVFPPHEMLAAIFSLGGKAWSECILGPGGEPAVAQFWEHEKAKPYFQSHPVTRPVGVLILCFFVLTLEQTMMFSAFACMCTRPETLIFAGLSRWASTGTTLNHTRHLLTTR